MKHLPKLLCSLLILIIASCSSGFDSKKAHALIEKETLTTEEYSEMIQIYENGIDDALRFSKESSKGLSADQKEEMMLIFAIGMRLSKDEGNLTPEQRKEFERITLKGTEEDPAK